MTQTQQLGARSLTALRLARRSSTSSLNVQTHAQLARRTTAGLDALCARTSPLAEAAAAAATLQPPHCRTISTTRVVAQRKNARSSEANEALLAQQMLDFMAMDSDDDAESADGLASKLPVTGVVMDVKNSIASISGLRHATIGSVVAISGATDDDADDADATPSSAGAAPLCRGVVLFLEKKVAHVALFSERSRADAVRLVQTGMRVVLESEQLEITASAAKFAGKAVDPLGEPIDLVYSSDATDSESATTTATSGTSDGATERISIAWGSKTVPGLMQRAPLKEPLATGILAIDCFHPLARGHRFGLLGPRNSGKTRLMLDIIAHQVRASLAAGVAPPHFVYVSVGKPATRVQQILEFLDHAGALPYTTIVSADDRDSRIKQYLAPFAGVAIAEYFMTHSAARHSVVVYDDLATHTVVVESLVETMKLPRVSQLSLSAHTILMERSAALIDARGGGAKALTTFAIADTPDSAAWETTALQQKMRAIVDDSVTLEGALALQRVYPPVDVLAPGGSICGPPFQSATLWKYMTRLRALVNTASQTRANVDVAKKLGFEVEPDDSEVLAVQDLVRQFFEQKPLATVADVHRELGVFFLTGEQVYRLPVGVAIWDFVRDVTQRLADDAPELLHLLETHPRDKAWPQYVEDELLRVFVTHITALRKARQSPRRRV